MRSPAPILLFLDENPEKSATYLTNFILKKSVERACQVLMCSIYYVLGFRTKTIFRHYFSKDRWHETKFTYLPKYPLDTIPKYTFYTSVEARWCRKCLQHYNYVSKYFSAMLDEWFYRFGKEHPLEEMREFLMTFPMEHSVATGVLMPSLKDKSKMQFPWKNLPLKYRRKDIVSGYRAYYRHIVPSNTLFDGTRRDVPEFMVEREELMA